MNKTVLAVLAASSFLSTSAFAAGQFVSFVAQSNDVKFEIADLDNKPSNGACDSQPQITRGELDAMISSGADVTKVCTSGITDFSEMFHMNLDFNQDISGWDVSNGINFSNMFAYSFEFNQDIGGWDVSNGVNFSSMFQMASAFNKNIGGWDVSNGEEFRTMFGSAQSFNQPLSKWNVSKGWDFAGMFSAAISFDQNISGWDVSSAQFNDDADQGSPIEGTSKSPF